MKIRHETVNKLFRLTSAEMELFLYIGKYQDERTGIAEGVYYKDVIEKTGMCRQSFYNALRGMERKGIIKTAKASGMDYRVEILGNAFPEGGKAAGYVNLNRKIFRNKDFRRLKAREKCLVMYFMRGTFNGNIYSRKAEGFYKELKELLSVSGRVLKRYMHSLKQFFTIWVKNGVFHAKASKEMEKQGEFESDAGADSESLQFLQHQIRKECWRNHISIEEKAGGGEAAAIRDTAQLAMQYKDYTGAGNRRDGMEKALEAITACIRRSVEGLRQKERKLRPKYIHKMVREELGCATGA